MVRPYKVSMDFPHILKEYKPPLGGGWRGCRGCCRLVSFYPKKNRLRNVVLPSCLRSSPRA